MQNTVQTIQQFLDLVGQSLQQNTFVKLSLGNYKGSNTALKQLLVKPIMLKNAPMVSVVYRNKTNDITKNLSPAQFLEEVNTLLNYQNFCAAFLQTTTTQWQLEVKSSAKVIIVAKSISSDAIANTHNRNKQKAVTAQATFLQALKITDATGQVIPAAADKYRQINHFIELLKPVLSALPTHQPLNIVDMGSGKGYLTFALYHYLQSHGIQSHTVGVELRPDMVALCNNIANETGFTGLQFLESDIQNFTLDQTNLLIALHACDFATDLALAKGIKAQANAIVVAPCCHKQIRKELRASKHTNILDTYNQYGIFQERQAEMLTDGIRALLLNYFGYKTKVLEFVSVEHTPKNVLIIAERKATPSPKVQAQILQQLQDLKAYFGIEQHYLEGLVL
jgi:SAM-dependent methyltransferase